MAGKIAWYLRDGATTDPEAGTRRQIRKLLDGLDRTQAREWAEIREEYEDFDGEPSIEIRYLRAFLRGRVRRNLLWTTPVQLAKYRDPHRITVREDQPSDLGPAFGTISVCGYCGIEIHPIRGGFVHSTRVIERLIRIETGQELNPCDCGKGSLCPQYGSALMVLGGIR